MVNQEDDTQIGYMAKIDGLLDTFFEFDDDYELNNEYITQFWMPLKCHMQCMNKFADEIIGDAPLLAKGKVGEVYDKGTYVIKKTIGSISTSPLYVETTFDIPSVVACIQFSVPDPKGDRYVHLSSGNNDFVNQTIMSQLIERVITSKANGPNDLLSKLYVKTNNVFVHRNIGYTSMDKIEGGTFTQLIINNRFSPSVLDTILMDCAYQMLLVLSVLKDRKHSFVHADLKTDNILVDKHNYKISDFDKSSMTFNGVRFYNKSALITAMGYADLTATDDWYTLSSRTIYSINNAVNKSMIMHNMYPFFSSYDIYTLFYSMMRLMPVAVALSAGLLPKFQETLDLIWYKGEQERLMNGLFDMDPRYARSITAMTYDLGVKGVHLMRDVDRVYEHFGITAPSTRCTVKLRNVTRAGKSLCATKCKNNKCGTLDGKVRSCSV